MLVKGTPFWCGMLVWEMDKTGSTPIHSGGRLWIRNQTYNRRIRIGGGVAILTREGVSYKQQTDFEELTIESVVECCAIELPNLNTILINIYRGDRKIDIFFEILTILLNNKNKTSTCIYLLFTNNKKKSATVVDNGVSDHMCLFYSCKVTNNLIKLHTK